MFDTTVIGKRIKQARIDRNMTQMALADAMEVSFQAVSNWERSNSMPDISKLEDLCHTLGITVNSLLGLEESAPNAVTKAMGDQELTMEELVEVAPMLPPKTIQAKVEEQTTKKGKRNKLNLSKIIGMAPFLDQEYLDELVCETEVDDLDELAGIAPFLSRETIDKLVSRCTAEGSFSSLAGLARFISSETLDRLAENVQPDSIWDVIAIAPFFGCDSLDALVNRCEDAGNTSALAALAPFVSDDVLDGLVDRYIKKGGDGDLSGIYPFLSKETLRKLAQYMMEQKDLDSMENIMPFI